MKAQALRDDSRTSYMGSKKEGFDIDDEDEILSTTGLQTWTVS